MNTRIGFSTPKRFNPVSALIRWFTKSTVSHAFFIYHDKDWDADMVLEAHEFGFRLMPLAHFEKKNTIVASFTPKVSIEEGVKYVAMTYLGTAYDFGGLFGSAIMLFGRWLRRKWHNPWESAQAVFCSEAVVIAMQVSKYPGSEELEPRDTTPQDLLQFFTDGTRDTR